MNDDNGLADALHAQAVKDAEQAAALETYRTDFRAGLETRLAGLRPTLEDILNDRTLSHDVRDTLAALTVVNAQTAALLSTQIANLTALVLGVVPEERREKAQKGLEDMTVVASEEIQKYINDMED